MDQEVTSALETPEDAGKGDAGIVKRWLMELELADKSEKNWRTAAQKAVERYRDEGEKKANRFNILAANKEIIHSSLYNSTPKPDVRRRFKDKDVLGKITADIIERAVSYSIDAYDFDALMDGAISDELIPGRGVAWVRYTPVLEQQKSNGETYDAKTFETVECELVNWQDFRRGAAKVWADVPWVARKHLLTRADIESQFKGVEGIELDHTIDDSIDKKIAEAEPDVFKRALIWEIWDKEGKERIFIAPSKKDAPVKVDSDPLNLRNFFPCPRPLYAISTTDTLVPIEEYRLYRDQAEELDKITQRINKLIGALKHRGVYDSTMTELANLMKASDSEFLPIENAATILALQGGKLENAIWTQPIENIAKVLQNLYIQRDQIKQVIYEITGISDILRGASNPNETLGAQKLKAQTGSLRIQRRQRDVQRFARDLIRLKSEIIAEHFAPETLQKMTGVALPTAQDKAQAQAVLQPSVPGAPPPNPQDLQKAQQVMSQPTWDEVMALLKDDALRSFRIDIETDSTIAGDVQADREALTDLMTGMGEFMNTFGLAIQQGAIPKEVGMTIMASMARRMKLGRPVEDAIDQMENQPPQQGPDPKAESQKADIQIAQIGLEGKKIDAQTAEKELSIKQMEHQNKAAELGMAQNEQMAGPVGQTLAVMDQHKQDAQVAAQQATQASQGTQQMAQAVMTAMMPIVQSLDALVQRLNMIQAEQQSPKQFTVERDGDGKIVGATVQPSMPVMGTA